MFCGDLRPSENTSCDVKAYIRKSSITTTLEPAIITRKLSFYYVFVYYIDPVTGVVVGVALLKKPEKKALGITVLFISIAICVAVALWKVNRYTKTRIFDQISKLKWSLFTEDLFI